MMLTIIINKILLTITVLNYAKRQIERFKLLT